MKMTLDIYTDLKYQEPDSEYKYWPLVTMTGILDTRTEL